MKKDDDVEMFVAGLVLDPTSNAPIVILKDATGEAGLPIWIGLPEATAIASAIKKVGMSRPMTHDLMHILLEQLGAKIVRICIHSLMENTFHACIELAARDVVTVLDSRPSDAIALAVRAGASIFVARTVLDQAKVTMVPLPEGEVSMGAGEGDRPDFSNIDKDKWAEILNEMDPDDFKYKM